MTDVDDAELWWSKLTPETQELLVTDPGSISIRMSRARCTAPA